MASIMGGSYYRTSNCSLKSTATGSGCILSSANYNIIDIPKNLGACPMSNNIKF